MNKNSNEQYILNRALSFRYDDKSEILFVGQMKPHNKIIKDQFGILKSLVLIFNKKSTLKDAFKSLIVKNTNKIKEINEAISLFLNCGYIKPYSSKLNRYDRHDLFASLCGVNNDSAKSLADKSLAIIGIGGIGSNCATLAASAGIGKLILVDADKIELSNLTRTTLFSEEDIGQFKVSATKKTWIFYGNLVILRVIQNFLINVIYHIIKKN